MSSDRCLLTRLFDLGALLCLSGGGLGLCYFFQLDGVETGQLFSPEHKAEAGGCLFRIAVLASLCLHTPRTWEFGVTGCCP